MPSNSTGLKQKRAAAPGSTLAGLMVAGGDARLHLIPNTHLNGYGCQPWPRPQEISFSSTTASTISQPAYFAADAAFQILSNADSRRPLKYVFEELVEKVRQDIKALFELDAAAEVVLSPSGTDSELHALFLANCVLQKPITSVVVAADETGNGVNLAASGRHFDSITSGGRRVIKGEPISGFATQALNVPVAARDRNGHARSSAEIDEDVHRCVAKAVDEGRGVALHVMDHSKTGARHPSRECLSEIASIYRNSVQIIVDACQARLSRNRLKWYLDQQYIVLVTGSKFFTGPPFSGALIVPASISARMGLASEIPDGLADYTSQFDWPRMWGAARSKLPASMNLGQLLRWIAATEEMQAYFEVPELLRKIAVRESAAAILRSIDRYPNLQLLPVANLPSTNSKDADEFETQTIFPFLIMRGNRPFSFSESRKLYRALNEDISGLLRAQGIPDGSGLAAQLCHIGQPVAVSDGTGGFAGALRLSVDARMVCQFSASTRRPFGPNKAVQPFNQLQTVLDKLLLLTEQFSQIECEYGPS